MEFPILVKWYLFLTRQVVNTGWWDIDIHGCFSLVKIAFAPICAFKNNWRIWRHNVSVLHSLDVTDQLWWRHNTKSEKSENHLQIASRVTPKSLSTVTHALFFISWVRAQVFSICHRICARCIVSTYALPFISASWQSFWWPWWLVVLLFIRWYLEYSVFKLSGRWWWVTQPSSS